MKPLFMWAGGKNKMLKHYKPYMPSSVTSYCEPFFGGGAMFIYVMNTYSPSYARINDINSDIINIYRSIKNDLDEFKDRLNFLEKEYIPKASPTEKNTRKDKKGKRLRCDRWHYFMEVRHEHAFEYEKWSKPKEAATLYFLMKTGFNGIFQINKNTNSRYGTPPGLLHQEKQVYDRDSISWWHDALQRTDIFSCNWKEVVDECPENTFYFFDPPYRDSFADYGQGFSDDSLKELMEFVEENKNVWLSNRDSGDGFFENRKATLKKFPVTYTAGRRKKTENGFAAKKATEILLYN